MKRIVEYVIECSDRDPLENTLRKNGYTFQFPSMKSSREPIRHESRGEEGWFRVYAGTPVGEGGTTLTVEEGTELEEILFDLYKELKN